MWDTVKYWYGDNAPVFFALFVITTLAVTAVQHHKKRAATDLTDVTATAVSGTAFLTAKFVAGLVVFGALSVLVFERWRLWTLDMSNPLVWVGVFALRDFVYYWVHRGEHRVAVLWASHMVHHSAETISPLTALRVPWMEALYKPWLSLWMPLLGFNPVAAVCLDVLAASIGQLQHTTRWRRYSAVDWVFVTPSTHRVHHGANAVYLDKNFGAVFVIWDRLFGTYQRETEPVTYGLAGKRLRGPVDMLRGGYPELTTAWRAEPSLTAKLRHLAAPPHTTGPRRPVDAARSTPMAT
jgi:sterol desaturase/sphingolipid hydroxylase (fatty acid hydroxylase superfamily)